MPSPEEMKQRVLDAAQAEAKRRKDIVEAGGRGRSELFEKDISDGFSMIGPMLSTNLLDGAEAWFAAQVTGSWTAFETCAEAAWVAALNTHPRGLAELKSVRKGTATEPRRVPLDWLQKYDYDLSHHMGDMLKERYSFDRLDGIRAAYADAGFDGDKKIASTVTHKSLDALALIRNVIVHNGGIVDQKYLDRMADIPGPVAELGSPLLLDGEQVGALVATGAQSSANLLRYVDIWLAERGVGGRVEHVTE
ncbi:MAG: hypothetical protein QOD94_2101 [Alphaproteobacteria bacterium]|jgi:hypothetical protein|nr:hypothetical protein [Alphaproteobacteria bacterium]